jgi:hypothetical protein
VISGIVPIVFYFATNGVFDKRVQRYIIISSGLTVTSMSYYLIGTTFCIPLFTIFFCVVLKTNLSSIANRAYALVLLVCFCGILFSHAATTLSLAFFLNLGLILMITIGFVRKSSLGSFFVHRYMGIFGLVSVILIAWLSLKVTSLFEFFIQVTQSYLTGSEISTPLPSTFFRLPLFDALKVFALHNATDAVAVVLTAAGLLVLFKKLSRQNSYLTKRFYLPLICYLVAMLFLFCFAFTTGRYEYSRFLAYALALSPFFIGLFLWDIDEHFKNVHNKTWIRSFVFFFLIFGIISVSLIQIFPYQPLTPGADVLSEKLPANEYIFDFRGINTIYQIDMIHFAERLSSSNARIASDTVTKFQIQGFAGVAFANRVIWYSPLDFNFTELGREWDICLLHYDGRSGPLNELVANRTRAVIDEFRANNGNTVYDNGESFVLCR